MSEIRIQVSRYTVKVKVDGENKIHELSQEKESTYEEKVTDLVHGQGETPTQQAITNVVKKLTALNHREEKRVIKEANKGNSSLYMKKWIVTNVKP